jgi:uncharacterized membrane protein
VLCVRKTASADGAIGSGGHHHCSRWAAWVFLARLYLVRQKGIAPETLPAGPTGVSANDINNSGAAVGSGVSGNFNRSFYWPDHNSTPSELQLGSFSGTFASGLNDRGQIVGSGSTPPASEVPVIWQTPTSPPTPLPLGGVTTSALATSINNLGQIVGFFSDGNTTRSLFWSSPTSKPVVLNPGDLGNTAANGINNAGQIVGTQSTFPEKAIYWSRPSSTPTVLQPGSFSRVTATAINNNGKIIGNGDGTPIMWSGPTSIPVGIVGDQGGFPAGINDAGILVGSGPSYWQPRHG